MILGNWYWTLYGLLSYDILNLFLPYNEMLSREIGVAEIKPGMRILDAGCGTGNLIWRIKKRFSGIRIIGVDFTPGLLRIAKLKSIFSNGNNIFLRAHDLNKQLHVADEAFDRIFCSNVLYALNDPDSVLKEFRRVLKPSGRLILTNPVKGYNENAPFSDHMKRAPFFRRVSLLLFVPVLLLLKLFNVIIKGNPNYHYYTKRELEKLLVDSGFRILVSEDIYSGIDHLVVVEGR